MNIELKELEKKDYKKAIKFAVKGMHFNMYIENKYIAYLYGKYFLYSEMLKATQIISAYNGDEFLGLLISKVNNEKRVFYSLSKKIYVDIFDFIQHKFFKSSAGEYAIACEEMLNDLKREKNPDGEIVFLAADPDAKIKGIGTKLLEEYEKRERGKLIYLYTDDMCTYQFYDHRGFQRVGERDIILKLKKDVNLKCMLYSKKID